MVRRLVVFSPGVTEEGGAAKQARVLLQGLAERGWRIKVLGRAGTYSRFRLVRWPGITVLEIPGFHGRWLGALLYYALAVPLGLIWGARAAGFIAVQLYSPLMIGGLCAAVYRRPFVAWTTTSELFSEAAYISSSRIAPLRRWLAGKARSIVAQTPAVAAELAAVYPRERVVVLPNPVESVEATPLDGRPRALFAGRFAEEKNLERLLDGWSALLMKLPDARLTLLGGGGSFRGVEEQLVEKIAGSTELARSVDLPGWVEDVSSYLASHDVYVLPSLTEGMSNALLEACAWRRIVVASDIAPNRAVLGEDYPLLFDPHDVSALTDTLRAAFGDERVRRQARSAIDQRAESFAAPTVVARWEELLLEGDRH